MVESKKDDWINFCYDKTRKTIRQFDWNNNINKYIYIQVIMVDIRKIWLIIKITRITGILPVHNGI